MGLKLLPPAIRGLGADGYIDKLGLAGWLDVATDRTIKMPNALIKNAGGEVHLRNNADTGYATFYCLTLVANGGASVEGTMSSTDDVNAAGGFCMQFWFYQDNVAAGQAAVALLLGGDVARTERIAVRSGSVRGIAVSSNAARTAGTLTVDATVDGTATGLQAVLDGTNTLKHVATQGKDLDTFAQKGLVGVKITTSADWAPTTADITVEVLVEL